MLGRSITAAATIAAGGTTEAGGQVRIGDPTSTRTHVGGAVHVDGASGGSITLKGESVRASGTLSANGTSSRGGTVLLDGPGVSVSGDIHADGPEGGKVTVQGTDLHVTRIRGDSITADGTTGRGGDVHLLGSRRDTPYDVVIFVTGGIRANGASGGSVKIEAPDGGSLTLAPLSANGSAGPGGTVTISTTGDFTLPGQISADGVSGGHVMIKGKTISPGPFSLIFARGTTGAGGIIDVSGSESVTVRSVQAGGSSGGSISIVDSPTIVVTGALDATGSSGVAGSIVLTAAESVVVGSESDSTVRPRIAARGNDANGGRIDVRGKSLALYNVDVDASGHTAPGNVHLVGPDGVTIAESSFRGSHVFIESVGGELKISGNVGGFPDGLSRVDLFGKSVSVTGAILAKTVLASAESSLAISGGIWASEGVIVGGESVLLPGASSTSGRVDVHGDSSVSILGGLSGPEIEVTGGVLQIGRIESSGSVSVDGDRVAIGEVHAAGLTSLVDLSGRTIQVGPVSAYTNPNSEGGVVSITGIESVTTASIDASGSGRGGTVAISSSGELSLGAIDARGLAGVGGSVSIDAPKAVVSSPISANGSGGAGGGRIRIAADSIQITGPSSALESDSIDLQAEREISITDGAAVVSFGGGGELLRLSAPRGVVIVDSALVLASGLVPYEANLSIVPPGEEDPVPQTVRVENGGSSGGLEIDADQLHVRAGFIEATSFGRDAAGSLDIHSREFDVRAGVVAARTFGAGRGGSVLVTAPGGMTLADGSSVSAAASTAAEFRGSPQEMGLKEVLIRRLEDEWKHVNGVVETLELLYPEKSTGAAGGVLITTGRLALATRSSISSESSGSGDAGSVGISASALHASGGSEISARAPTANGGDITLLLTDRLHLTDSAIIADVGSGKGGNILIDPPFVILDHSQILATAGKGRGGEITIVADALIKDPTSLISASAGDPTRSGTVDINAPDVDLAGSLAALSESALDDSDQLAASCSARRYGESEGSFTLAGAVLRPGPEGWLSAWGGAQAEPLASLAQAGARCH